MTVFNYYRSVDPSYGSEPHQRESIVSMDRAQDLNPCTKDHDQPAMLPSGRPAPPCHITACYPTDRTGRMIGA